MKVAILTSRSRLESYSDPAMIPAGAELIHIGPNYTDADVIAQAKDADAIVVDAVLPVSAAVIEALPKLKIIHSEGVGYNRIDTEAAAKAGVFVCNNRALNAGQVAEHSVMLILAVLRRLSEGDMMVRTGHQIEAKQQFIMDGLRDLIGCRVGIVGFGAIGKELARRLAPFGCEVCYYDVFRASEEVEAQYGVTYLPQDELLATSDIVSLHLPVTPETTDFICTDTIAKMKTGAVVINCARGLIVNSADLAEAIRSGKIYGAGIDTLDPEPVQPDDPLIRLPEPWSRRVIFTPHVAGTTKSVFYAAYRGVWSNISRVANGERPINIVNGL